MTPDEILHDALDKITAQRHADQERLSAICAEGQTLHDRISRAAQAETSLEAILGAQPQLAPAAGFPNGLEGSAPSAGGDPAPAVDAEPVAEEAGPAELDIPALAARALKIARTMSPEERTERKVKMLAGAALKASYGLTNREVADALELKSPDICPAALVEARIFSEEIERAANKLKAGETGELAPTAAAAEPEPELQAKIAPEPSAFVRDLAGDLLVDLPKILENCAAGVSDATVADWFGCTQDQAREAAALLVRQGKAIAHDGLVRLPAGEAVPA